MNVQRISGVVLSVVGVILLTVGVNASHSVANRVGDIFPGGSTHATTWFIVGGIASTAIGLLLLPLSRGAKTDWIVLPDA